MCLIIWLPAPKHDGLKWGCLSSAFHPLPPHHLRQWSGHWDTADKLRESSPMHWLSSLWRSSLCQHMGFCTGLWRQQRFENVGLSKSYTYLFELFFLLCYMLLVRHTSKVTVIPHIFTPLYDYFNMDMDSKMYFLLCKYLFIFLSFFVCFKTADTSSKR